jgi:4-hydroxybenzoate polyprenyltransferase/phosphoserine phosphatase
MAELFATEEVSQTASSKQWPVADVSTINSEVLCIDFDRTFVDTDSVFECIAVILRYNPFSLLSAIAALRDGRAAMKEKLWSLAQKHIRVDLFPRQPSVIALAENARRMGKRVELVTAAHKQLVASDATIRNLFDDILASEHGTNLKAQSKAVLLAARHPNGFAYIGDSAADIPVWRAASERFAVNLSSNARRTLSRAGLKVSELARRPARLPSMLRAFRLHQWAKNLLIFVPFALQLHETNGAQVARFVFAFFLLGVLTSATYMTNDLFDLNSDRLHPSKRHRPFASGRLPIVFGLAAPPVMIVAAISGAYALSTALADAFCAYLILTLLYSFFLKRIVILDVLTIGALFTTRIVCGMALAGGNSYWLLNFSAFFFTSLALAKRDVELNGMRSLGLLRVEGRGYQPNDCELIFTVGIACGIASLVILSLFIAETMQIERQYTSPELLWCVPPLVAYWLLRLWLKTHRGVMTDDPIVFALKDRASIAVIGLLGVVVVLAQLIR